MKMKKGKPGFKPKGDFHSGKKDGKWQNGKK